MHVTDTQMQMIINAVVGLDVDMHWMIGSFEIVTELVLIYKLSKLHV